MMDKIVINFEALKEDAIQETYELFGTEHPDLELDLADAINDIDKEITRFKYIIKDIEREVKLGLIEKAIAISYEDYHLYMDEVQSIRHDPLTGYRTNSVNFGGGIAISNEYCKCLFLANLNIEIIGLLTRANNIDILATAPIENKEQSAEKESMLNIKGTLDATLPDVELKLREIALIHHYEKVPLTLINADSIVKKYRKLVSRTSGKQLVEHYTDIKNGGQQGIYGHANAVKDIENVLSLLRDKTSIALANEDLRLAKLKN